MVAVKLNSVVWYVAVEWGWKMSPVVLVGSATTTPAIRSTAMVASTAVTVATATVVTRMSLDRRRPAL